MLREEGGNNFHTSEECLMRINDNPTRPNLRGLQRPAHTIFSNCDHLSEQIT